MSVVLNCVASKMELNVLYWVSVLNRIEQTDRSIIS